MRPSTVFAQITVLVLLASVPLSSSSTTTVPSEDVDSDFTTTLSSAASFDDVLETTTMLSMPKNKTVVEKWEEMEALVKRLTSGLVKRIIQSSIRSDSRLNVSSSCMGQVIKLLSGLKNLRPWAFSFIDASGKIIDGMLAGTMAALGEYDQCIAIEAPDERRGRNQGKVLFTGQYCALDIKPPLPPRRKHFYKIDEIIEELKNISQRDTIIGHAARHAQLFYLMAMRIGICVPSGCSPDDITQLTNRIANRVTIKVKRCEGKKDYTITSDVLAILCVYSFFGLLLIIGTTLDVFGYYSKRTFKNVWLQVLLAFSFKSNFQKLVNTENTSGPLACFSGLRVISITWIVLAHTYLNLNLQLFRNLRRALSFPHDLAFQAIINATVAVDTFFLMGGTLVCYLMVKLVKERGKSLNIGLYIFHRIYRIYPIYSLAIAFMFLAPLLAHGPVWHDTVDPFTDSCHKNWWTNLLFVNNFIDAEHMCLPQSWYLACDVQLYIVALVILLPLMRWPKFGLSLAVFGILASMIVSAAIIYVNGYPPTMLFVHPDHDQRMTQWATSYFKPYAHAGPYFVGILLGYLLAVRPKLKFSLPVRIVGWSSAIACNLAVLYGVWEWNKGVDPNVAETIFYSSCHRVAWSLGVAWVVANCAAGQGGVVNYILTWKPWVVLGRLTYGAYLLHPMVQIAAVGSLRMMLMPWHHFGVWMFFGHLFITYFCSFAATMLVEAPFLALEKIMFRKQIEEVKKDLEKKNGLAMPQQSNENHMENGSARTDNNNTDSQLRKRSADEREFVCRL